MLNSLYDAGRILTRAAEWRIEAAAAPFSTMRAFCLDQADQCEKLVRQSMEAPVLSGDRSGTGAGPRHSYRAAQKVEIG
jgi:hypothetical protein